MIKTLKNIALAVVCCGLSIPAQASSPYFVVGYVWSSVGTPGTVSTANSYAGVTVLRHNMAGQPAVQMGGPDPLYSSRIYPALAGRPAYFATDAGSQWTTPMNAGWTLLTVVETAPGTHGWTGQAFAGAVKSTVNVADMGTPRYTMPSSYPAKIPMALLDWASNTKIALKIGYFEDAGGLAQSLALFRRENSGGSYQWLGNTSLPAPGTVVNYQDASVTANTMYDYAVAVNFVWPGGGGVGGLPGQTEIYSTIARAVSGPYMASDVQPTPTALATQVIEEKPKFDVPEGWLAYPNPATGPNLFVAIKTELSTDFRIRAYNLVGEQVLVQSGNLATRGVHKIAISISKFASGIYFLKLDLKAAGASRVELPVHKIAILH